MNGVGRTTRGRIVPLLILVTLGTQFESCLMSGSMEPTAGGPPISVGVSEDRHGSVVTVMFQTKNTSHEDIYGWAISFEVIPIDTPTPRR